MSGFSKAIYKAAAAFTDMTVFLSFGTPGFHLRERLFDPADTEVDMAGKICLVTGSNSGIGFATASELYAKGAEVWLLVRNRQRGEDAAETLRKQPGGSVQVAVVDISAPASIEAFAEDFPHKHVDVLINNAGVLPTERILTNTGIELTWATNTIGPFLLTHLLLPKLKAAPQGRVINISSGGMYPQKLDLSDLTWEHKDFDGVKAYANTKRAMVILTQMWAERLSDTSVTVNSMHPGWADTPAVQSSIPTFHRVTKSILRTPAQGADTAVWLAVSPSVSKENGEFWFDREKKSIYKIPGTRESMEDRIDLWNICMREAGLD